MARPAQAREAARSDRIHGASGVIPTPLWVVLFFTSVVIFVYLLFFADSGERAVVQAFMMGRLSRSSRRCCCCLSAQPPIPRRHGGLRPVAMERALRVINKELPHCAACIDVSAL